MENLIKEKNLRILRDILRKEKVAAKAKLSKLTGISVVTIQSLLDTLITNGEVFEDEIVKLSIGRPPLTYRYNERYGLVLCIYMFEKNGKDTALFDVADLYGEVIDTKEVQFEEVNINVWDEVITEFVNKYKSIKLLTFGMPGVHKNGTMVVCDYKKLSDINMTEYFEEKFNIKTIVENDINLTTYGFYKRNVTDNEEIAVGIYMPSKYPPGAGICINGKILWGKDGFVGEINKLQDKIDWNNFDYNRKDVEDYYVRLIWNLIIMYNPHKIVIYDEAADDDMVINIEENMSEFIREMLMPELIIKSNTFEDYRQGIIRLALENIL